MIARRWALQLFVLLAATAAQASDLDTGLAAAARKDYEVALRHLLPLASSGSAAAQLRVAEMYFYGHGVKESDKEALRWYESAARQGLAAAQFEAGNMYAYGLGVDPLDSDADQKAAKWYHAAALQGHAEAQYALAVLFLAGKGVEHSTAEADKWMLRAAANGHTDARSYVRTLRP